MQSPSLVNELALIAAVAVVVTVVLARLRLPAVAGLLFAGFLAGPSGLALVHSSAAIEALAELGVVLLLFTIGLEFSLARLRHILRRAALGGALQVGLTILTAVGVGMLAGIPLATALFYGFAFALSSTAIVLRALTERHELDAPHGRFIVGVLLFQDLCVVPMVLIVPLLGAARAVDGAALAIAFAFAFAKAALVVVVLGTVARFLVPRLLAWVDASRSREVFLLAIIALCIGTAWLTSLAGLSLALGAFLGGMVVADTDFSQRALGSILPLRDAFVSLFFMSLGMLFEPRLLVDAPLHVLALLAGFLGVKGVLATLAAFAMRFPARVAWLAGVGLAQFGELGFVLTGLAEANGVVEPGATRPLLAAGILSMFLTPILVRIAPHITAGERLLAPLERLIGVRSIDEADGPTPLADHVVLVGFGVAGRLVARSLTACGIPFVAIELNAETVRTTRAAGLPVYYGDATSDEALGHARLAHARALVLLVNDPQAAERVVDTARRVAPNVPVLMRTRYLGERERLLTLGASDVVAEEVEGAVEVLARALRWLELPRNLIDAQIHVVRGAAQTSARTPTVPRHRLGEHRALAAMKIESVAISATSPALGRSPLEMDFRAQTGALIVAVLRDTHLLDRFDPRTPLQAGDVAYLVGTTEAVGRAVAALAGPVET